MQSLAKADGEVVLGLLKVGSHTIALDVESLVEVAHIPSLQPSLRRTTGVLGMLPIRGSLVPVCDPLNEFENADGENYPRIAAVISNDTGALGLAVDGVKGLRSFNRQEIQSLERASSESTAQRMIYSDHEVIHILDSTELLNGGNYPRANTNLRNVRKKEKSAIQPHLTFKVGSVFYAIKAEYIFGTVPRQRIEDLTLSDDRYLGSIKYFKRRVPVVDTNMYLKLGSARTDHDFETVVLRFPNGKLVGMAVDQICKVVYPTFDSIRSLKVSEIDNTSLITSTGNFDKVEHFLVNEERLLCQDELLSISEISSENSEKKKEDFPTNVSANEVEFERQRYLIFSAGSDFAVPMLDIVGMREAPTKNEIIPTTGNLVGAQGLYFSGNTYIPLVDLENFLNGNHTETGPDNRVLITEFADQKVAFLVKSIIGIATSKWRTINSSDQNFEFGVVALHSENSIKIKSLIDFRDIFQRIFQPIASSTTTDIYDLESEQTLFIE